MKDKSRSIVMSIGIIVTLLTLSITEGTMAVYAWQLDVNLRQSEFGTSRAEVTVYGPFGWIESGYWATGPPPLIASINVPDNEIPEGYQYQVCVGAGLITFDPNCEYFTHGSGDESVTMVMPG